MGFDGRHDCWVWMMRNKEEIEKGIDKGSGILYTIFSKLGRLQIAFLECSIWKVLSNCEFSTKSWTKSGKQKFRGSLLHTQWFNLPPPFYFIWIEKEKGATLLVWMVKGVWIRLSVASRMLHKLLKSVTTPMWETWVSSSRLNIKSKFCLFILTLI